MDIKTTIINVAKTGLVKAKPFVVPMLGALVTTAVQVKTEQKAEARLLGMEKDIESLKNLLNK